MKATPLETEIVDDAQQSGKLRQNADRLIALLAAGRSNDQIQAELPGLTVADIDRARPLAALFGEFCPTLRPRRVDPGPGWSEAEEQRLTQLSNSLLAMVVLRASVDARAQVLCREAVELWAKRQAYASAEKARGPGRRRRGFA